MNFSFSKERKCSYCGSSHYGLYCPSCGSSSGGNEIEKNYYVIDNGGLMLSGVSESAVIALLKQDKIGLNASISVDGKEWHLLHNVVTIGGKTFEQIELEKQEKLKQDELARQKEYDSRPDYIFWIWFFGFLFLLIGFLIYTAYTTSPKKEIVPQSTNSIVEFNKPWMTPEQELENDKKVESLRKYMSDTRIERESSARNEFAELWKSRLEEFEKQPNITQAMINQSFILTKSLIERKYGVSIPSPKMPPVN